MRNTAVSHIMRNTAVSHMLADLRQRLLALERRDATPVP